MTWGIGIGLMWQLQRSARYQNSNAITEKCQKLWHQRWSPCGIVLLGSRKRCTNVRFPNTKCHLWHQRWKHLWHCGGVAAKKRGVPNSSSWAGQWLPSRMRSHFSYRPRNAAVFLLIYFSYSSYGSFFSCRLYSVLKALVSFYFLVTFACLRKNSYCSLWRAV